MGALRPLLVRAAWAPLIMLAVSLVVVVVLRLLPADPVAMSLPPGASAADYARLRADFGLDRPLAMQYLGWLGRTLGGDLGTSIFFRRPVGELVLHALPATLELVAAGLLAGAVMGIAGGLGLFATGRGWVGSVVGTALEALVTAAQALPEFLWALLLILLLGVAAPVLPFIGRLDPAIALPPARTGFLLMDSVLAGRWDALGSALLHLVMPAAALGIGLAPLVARVLRASLLEAAREDHVTQARRRGLPERQVVLAHVLPNALLPTAALLGVQGGFMFGGTVLVEAIFAYPGLGALMVDAVRNHDLPVIQAVALAYCGLVLLLNAAADGVQVLLDPRLRHPAAAVAGA